MTLEQLRVKAHADLTSRHQGVLLEWSMLVAEAAGKVRGAQEHLSHLEYLQRDFRSSMLGSFPPSDERVERFQSYVVNDGMLATARSMLGEAVAYHRAGELVLVLLERKPVAKVTPELHSLPGGKAIAK